MKGDEEAEMGLAQPWAEEGEEEEENQAEPAPGEEGVRRKKYKRRIRKPRAIKRANAEAQAAAAAAASSAPEVGPTDNNQGVPGSVEGGPPMNELEAGQSQQEEADAIWQDQRIVDLIARHNRHDDEQRASTTKLITDLADAQTALADKEAELGAQKRANRQEASLSYETSQRLEDALQEVKDANAAAKTDRQRLQISQNVIDQLKKEVETLASDLTNTTRAKHQLEAEKDEAEVLANGLQERIDALEIEASGHEDDAAEILFLQDQIADVHIAFEDAFTDMARDLNFDEKFAYVREQMKAAPTGRPRIVSTASLHEELDDADTRSDHAKAAPKEVLSISHITSVETVPVAVTTAPKKTTTLGFSGITAVDTKPVAVPTAASAVAVAPKKPTTFGFSGLTTVDTSPVAVPAAAPAAVPAAATRPKAPLAFSGITSVETSPIPTPPIERPAPEIRVQWRTPRRIIIDRPVAVVPWWMWLSFLVLFVAIVACATGFAGLLREKQIWLDANDMAYQRLIGAGQETWPQSLRLGVHDLLPGVASAHSLFG